MPNPTDRALTRSGALQTANRQSEKLQVGEVTEQEARAALIRTREDVSGLAALSAELHRQLVTISRGIWALVVIALVAAIGLLLRR